jgi:D-amino-acid oxidase
MKAMSQALDVIVVGGGVSGLTCAVVLAESGRHVRLIARAFSPDTTSDVAGAVWYPFHAGPPDKALAWGAETFRVFRELAATSTDAGVMLVDGIELFPGPAPARPGWADTVDDFRDAGPDVLPMGYTAGWLFRVPTVAMGTYLAWLAERFRRAGGEVAVANVERLDDLFAAAPVVVNCTGLGARELVDDPALLPIRGQVVRVAAGYAHRFVQASAGPGELAYIIPRVDLTVLGGTTDHGAWDTVVQPDVAEAILARCIAIEPALVEAPVLSHAVGLRPYRAAVRLAAEQRPGGLLVHNYGHGGSGVTLSWGCAAEVLRLVPVDARYRAV